MVKIPFKHTLKRPDPAPWGYTLSEALAWYHKAVDKAPNAQECLRLRSMVATAPDMYDQLKRIQSWLFVDLLHPERPLDRESAAKAYHEINALLNSTIDKD